jgi:hypothetical protein
MNIHKRAIRYNDEYQCSDCGKCWDVKDPRPPECLNLSEINSKRLNEIRKQLK